MNLTKRQKKIVARWRRGEELTDSETVTLRGIQPRLARVRKSNWGTGLVVESSKGQAITLTQARFVAAAYRRVLKNPDRYYGFGHLPGQTYFSQSFYVSPRRTVRVGCSYIEPSEVPRIAKERGWWKK